MPVRWALYAGFALGLLMGAVLALTLRGADAADPWTQSDTAREAVYLGLHAMDWNQTRQIARDPNRYHELNPLLGEHPNTAAVDRYFALTSLAHIGLAYVLPADWRHTFQHVTIGASAATVYWNYRVGLKVDF